MDGHWFWVWVGRDGTMFVSYCSVTIVEVLQVSDRPSPREDIRNKSCGIYSCVYEDRKSVR